MIEETWTTIALPMLKEIWAGQNGDDIVSATTTLLTRAKADYRIERTLADLVKDGRGSMARP